MNPNELAYAVGNALGNALVWVCVATPIILALVLVYWLIRRRRNRKQPSSNAQIDPHGL